MPSELIRLEVVITLQALTGHVGQMISLYIYPEKTNSNYLLNILFVNTSTLIQCIKLLMNMSRWRTETDAPLDIIEEETAALRQKNITLQV